MATRFTFASASAPVTCASTPGLFTRKTLNWVCTCVISVAGGGFHGFFLRGLDGEDLIETSDAEQFHQACANATKDEIALFQCRQLLLHRQENSDGLGGEILDFFKIENNPPFIL